MHSNGSLEVPILHTHIMEVTMEDLTAVTTEAITTGLLLVILLT